MERVQLNLERLLPELRDLEKKKLFTKPEINEIVKRRTAFETALIWKGSNEQDWLGYIEYERSLEQLRKIRASKLKMKGRPTVSDYSISRHILSLYSSSVTRMPGSTRLWQAYIAHVLRVSTSSAEISRVLARAISLHPTNASIWLLAIRFEADGTGPQAKEGGIGGGNIDAARKLAMRALRFMKGAKDEDGQKIWLEWTRLEISFVERMRKRWEILGIGDAMTGKANMDVDGKDGEVEELPEPKDLAEDVDAAEEDVSVAQNQGKNAVLDGAIVKAVLENACAAYPQSVAMHRQLLETIRPLPTPLRSELLSHVYSILAAQLPTFTDPHTRSEARSILCKRYLADLATPASDGLTLKEVPIDSVEWIEAVGQTVKAFKAALAEEETIELQQEYAAVLAECSEKTEDAGLKQYLRIHMAKLIKGMQRKGSLSEDIVECARRCNGEEQPTVQA